MMRIVLAHVLVTMVMGEGCCPYDAWEGTLGLVTGTEQGGQSHLTLGALNLHVNSAKKIIVSEGEMDVDGYGFQLKAIQDYMKGTEYDIVNGKCTTKSIGPWKSRCIPDDAQIVQNTYIGAGSEKVAVKTYLYMEDGLQVYSTVTARDCVPIMSVQSGVTSKGVSTVTASEFSGITKGVKDPSIFNIPAICNPKNPLARYLDALRKRRSVDP
ncbi:hypothetical protein ACJMK2_034249 [Sinanodonta woodiana]|uniref:Uncharacterized protein n=1 Tax=Sinanodonta woodiana TaxID=1069815 RepID=A0ABD3WV52_SINWO